MMDDFVKKIKSKGYWRINFQPLVTKQKLSGMTECKAIIERVTVQLRGWDYPHFPRRQGDDTGLEPCGEYYQGWIDWENHKEFWRIYKSGQFLHYLALREDWFDEMSWKPDLAETIKPMGVLGITGSVTYQITEVYEFLSRLVRENIYDEGVQVSISLHNTKGRKLWVEDPFRVALFGDYKTGTNDLFFKETYTKEQILTDPKDLAFAIIMQILDAFGWNNIPVETIKKDQENLLSGKI